MATSSRVNRSSFGGANAQRSNPDTPTGTGSLLSRILDLSKTGTHENAADLLGELSKLDQTSFDAIFKKLDPNSLASLFSAVSNEQWQAIAKNISPEAANRILQAMSPEALREIPDGLVPQLDTAHLRIWANSNRSWANVSQSAIGGLNTAADADLIKSAFATLNSEQVKAVSPALIPYIPVDVLDSQLASLTDNQIHALSPEQLQALSQEKRNGLRSRLSSDQIDALGLGNPNSTPDERISSMSRSEVLALNDADLKNLTQSQIDRNIEKFSGRQLLYLSKNTNWRFNGSQLAKLSPSDIAALLEGTPLRGEVLRQLPPEKLEGVSSKWIKNAIAEFTPEQLHFLAAHHKLVDLSAAEITDLKDKPEFGKKIAPYLSDSQIQGLDASVFSQAPEFVADAVIQGRFTDAQLDNLSQTALAKIDGSKLNASLATKLIGRLPKSSIASLPDISELSPSQIKANLTQFSTSQLKQIRPDQAKEFGDTEWNYLVDNHLETARHLFQSVDRATVQAVPDGALKKLGRTAVDARYDDLSPTQKKPLQTDDEQNRLAAAELQAARDKTDTVIAQTRQEVANAALKVLSSFSQALDNLLNMKLRN